MNEQELVNIWEKSGLPVLVFPMGSCSPLYYNPRATALVGEDLFAALPPSDAKILQNALLTPGIPPYFCHLKQEVYSAVLMPYGDCTVCILHRVTEHYHRNQDALNEAIMASKAKTNFLSEMSHDIRTPMGAIVGLTHIALNHNNSPLKIQECLEKIKVASGHMMSLLNEVLDMSRIESGRITLQAERTNVADLLHEILVVAKPQADGGQLEFNLEMGPVHAENLMLDAVRLKQVCLNLLSNAIKYTPAGGRVDFFFAVEDRGPDQVQMTMRVRDNGIGMSKEFLTKVFDPFEREEKTSVNKILGTGLGMAITKNLVELMGGRITVESETGKGSCFSVEIPFIPLPSKEDTFLGLADCRVLLLDDDEKRAGQTIDMLHQLKMEVDWARNPGDLISYITDADLFQLEYYAFLTAEKISGVEMTLLLPSLHQRLGDCPMLLLTDNDWSQIEHVFTRSGIDGYIPLPLFKSRLAAGLTECREDPLSSNAAPSADRDLSGCRLLLAEDNELNREIATELLEDSGAIIECAEDGQEALDMFAASEPGYYQLILMDVQMPNLNGLEATRLIRQLDRPDATVPIVAMTANAFVEDVNSSLAAGMDAHISKPLDMDKMFSTMEALLRRQD